MIVVLDNRDSFVFNLARHFHLLGVETVVCPSHSTDVAGIASLAPRAIVISPGPCTPAEAGCSIDVIRGLRGRVPILGVCLGHQAIAAALGGRIIRGRQPVHGRTSPVHHDAVNLFAGIPSPMIACRYHSLVVDPAALPAGLRVTARDDEGTIMAIEHDAASMGCNSIRRRSSRGTAFGCSRISWSGQESTIHRRSRKCSTPTWPGRRPKSRRRATAERTGAW
jgi:anthranilate synthase component II